jgi:hypothetical protein
MPTPPQLDGWPVCLLDEVPCVSRQIGVPGFNSEWVWMRGCGHPDDSPVGWRGEPVASFMVVGRADPRVRNPVKPLRVDHGPRTNALLGLASLVIIALLVASIALINRYNNLEGRVREACSETGAAAKLDLSSFVPVCLDVQGRR